MLGVLIEFFQIFVGDVHFLAALQGRIYLRRVEKGLDFLMLGHCRVLMQLLLLRILSPNYFLSNSSFTATDRHLLLKAIHQGPIRRLIH